MPVKRVRRASVSLGMGMKCTPELTKRFAYVLARIGSLKETCSMVGITPATYYAWSAKGDQGIEPYKTFVATLAKAKPDLLLTLHERAEEGITMRPDMALALLKVHAPERFDSETMRKNAVIEEALRLIAEMQSPGGIAAANRMIDVASTSVPSVAETQAESVVNDPVAMGQTDTLADTLEDLEEPFDPSESFDE